LQHQREAEQILAIDSVAYLIRNHVVCFVQILLGLFLGNKAYEKSTFVNCSLSPEVPLFSVDCNSVTICGVCDSGCSSGGDRSDNVFCCKIHADTSFHVTKTLSIKVGTGYQSTGTRKAPFASGGVFRISKRAMH